MPLENVAIFGSHSHSGPGAISPALLWELAPAMDLLVESVRQEMVAALATALLNAERALQPAVLGVGTGLLTGVTVNRRAGTSPFLKRDSIDPHLGVLRIDRMDGTPIATLHNFALHGVCWGPEQLLSSADIMGGTNDHIERLVGGVSLFVNGDAGDIDPGPGMCDGKPNYKGSPIIAARVKQIRDAVKPSSQVALAASSQKIDFGPTNLNITLQRWANCTRGGPLDICGLCSAIQCRLNPHLGREWIETTPTFSAFRFTVDHAHTVLVTMPGEPLSTLGFEVRDDMARLGFNVTLLGGYA